MENKYYTPDITEFHVGFEYEMKERFGDGTVKTKEEYDNANWIKSEVINLQHFAYINRTLTGYNPHEHPSAIRVKYLDKEDIESLGFEYIKTHAGTTESYFELPHSEWGIEFDPDFFGNSYIRIYLYNSDGDTTYFSGFIKNKSELKVLLKQLGVA